MIELFFAPTPNGWKISILLEELGVPYRMTPVDLARGGQFEPEFLAISPNNKMPAIIDHAPLKGDPLPIFETGAIMLYLAEKYSRFLPADPVSRYSCIAWLMWQISGLGPTLGQHGHFSLYAEDKIPYAMDRFRSEAERHYGVLDRQLEATGRHVAGDDYTIADMACFPWIMTHKAQNIDIAKFPHVKRWFTDLRARPALQRGLSSVRDFKNAATDLTPDQRQRLFGLSPPETGAPATAATD